MQFLDRFVGMPVVEAPLVLTVQKPVEIRRVEFLEKIVAMTGAHGLTVQRPVEIPQVHLLDKIVDILVV